MGLIKPISISLSPNVESDDLWLAFKLILQPWKWKRGGAVVELEDQFKNYLNVKYAFAFNSGRTSLMAILRSLDAQEVLLQSFTCNAAVNPVRWAGLKPVYVDVDEDTFNIDTKDLENKAKDGEVIMVQHTFGIPANMDEIKRITQKHNLTLIEDCAHALGAEYHGQKVGTFGRAAFFSFSRDKIISSVYGGMVVTNDPSLAEKLQQAQDKFAYPSYFWIKQQLAHPLLMSLILPSYRVIGKYVLVLLQSLRILSKAVHWKEKQGLRPSYFPRKMPNALALLALNQFKKLNKFNQHRQEMANFYINNLKGFQFTKIPQNVKPVYLRLPIKHTKAHKIIRRLWNKNILIGDWYTSPIAPDDTQSNKLGYTNNCPQAEKLAKITLNLPTHINISKKQAREIIELLTKI